MKYQESPRPRKVALRGQILRKVTHVLTVVPAPNLEEIAPHCVGFPTMGPGAIIPTSITEDKPILLNLDWIL